MGRARGFTLIEVLVAVAIFALIGVAAAAMLSRTLTTRETLDTRAEQLRVTQRAVARLERDLLQHSVRGIRDAFGDPQPPLRLESGEILEFTVQGWRNPLQAPRSELVRVRWSRNREGALERSIWPVLDRAQDSEPVDQRILEEIDAVRFDLVLSDGGSALDWPADGGAPSAPTPLPGTNGDEAEDGAAPHPIALRFVLEVGAFGRVERLVPLGEAFEPQAEGAPGAGQTTEGDDQGEDATQSTRADGANG